MPIQMCSMPSTVYSTATANRFSASGTIQSGSSGFRMRRCSSPLARRMRYRVDSEGLMMGKPMPTRRPEMLCSHANTCWPRYSAPASCHAGWRSATQSAGRVGYGNPAPGTLAGTFQETL